MDKVVRLWIEKMIQLKAKCGVDEIVEIQEGSALDRGKKTTD